MDKIPPIFTDETLKDPKSHWHRVLSGEQVRNVEMHARKKDGTEIDIQVSAAPLHDTNGKISHVVCMAFDITEGKRTAEDLKRRNEELLRFTRAATGRELRMIELKKQVNELSRRLGEAPPYALDFLQDDLPSSSIDPLTEEEDS